MKSQPKQTFTERALNLFFSFSLAFIAFIVVTILAQSIAELIIPPYSIDPDTGRKMQEMAIGQIFIGLLAGIAAGVFVLVRSFRYFRSKFTKEKV